MDLLRVKPDGIDIGDGVRARYECQNCLTVADLSRDAYDVPTHIRCPVCGYYEGDANVDD